MNFRLLAFTFVASATAFPAPAAAPPPAVAPEDVLEAIGRCGMIGDNGARLACYDRLAPRVKDALAAPPEALNRAPTTEEQRSWFGFDLSGLFGASPSQQTTPQAFGSDRLASTKAKEETAAAEVDHISAQVSEVSFTPFGRFIIFLDNGQVWRQIEGDADRAIFKKPAKANTVTIGRGFIGSYNLSLNDSDKVYKVTRVK
ncbi:MAG TPA: hypothetical protein VHT03_07790 [Rhizomicrobium sp.]|jgi:hypothetical protein|nr:hypothetical protein [Rhizomicrobium sp.]